MIRNLFRRFTATITRLAADRRGNVAMTFALLLIPVIGGVGAAIDYSRANAARTAIQAALDATGLILSRDAQTLTREQLQAKAVSVFQTNFNRPDVKDLKITAAFSETQPGSFQLQLSATGLVKTTVMALWQPEMAIGSSAQVVWGMKRLELVLALDNTLSMASANKMAQLKLAAKDLLKTLQNAAKKPDDVKIGIVPFATDVNVDTANRSATWIRWQDWEETNGSCAQGGYSTKSSCESARSKWTPASRNTWEGCVTDRDQDNDVNNAPASAGAKATLYPASQAKNCPAAMITLTNNWSALNAKVDAMTPTGNTNVTIGLQMAFQMLSPVAPFNAAAPQADIDKVIILLTDGDNTQNRWSTNQKSIDARTRLACDNVKASNIKLYTVRVINGNASLLQDCATRSDMYYDVQNASQLSAVFSTIAQNLARLRLSK